MNFKKAFTLTEVLIAMAVLGIIVSASVPVILKMSPNKNAIMLKKAYYTTETIVNSLINDPELYNPEKGFNDTTEVSVNKSDGSTVTIGGNVKFRTLFATKLNANTSKEATNEITNLCSDSASKNSNNCVIYSNDGTLWILSAANFESDPPTSEVKIYVDVKDGLNNMSYYSPGFNGSDYDSKNLEQSDILECAPDEIICSTAIDDNNSNNAKKATERIKKHVDRAVFTITNDGQVKVENQQYISDIISGKTKIIGK